MKVGAALFHAVVLNAALAVSCTEAARAEDHLPIIDIQPVTTFSAAGGARDSQPINGPTAGTVVNGATNVAGSVTIPIVGGLSFAYDRTVNGVYHQTYDAVILPIATPAFGPPGLKQPGTFNDMVEQYRLDEAYHSLALELGLAARHRICCPGSGDPNSTVPSTEWHQAYLGLTYFSHAIGFLHDTSFVLGITGHSANHNPSPATLAFEQALSPGIVDIQKHEYGTSQAVTALIPVDQKHHFTAAATFTWGAFDYLENYPYPLTYDIWVFTATRQFNKLFSLELRQANVWQRPNQNTPFFGNAQHVAEWSVIANFHIDLNHLK